MIDRMNILRWKSRWRRKPIWDVCWRTWTTSRKVTAMCRTTRLFLCAQREGWWAKTL